MSMLQAPANTSALTAVASLSTAEVQPVNPYVSWYQDEGGAWHSNCTYWAWQRWFDVYGEALPSWGNAGEWAANAAASGYPVTTQPSVGSIVMTWESPLGHVAFVEAISDEDPNTFLISEYGFALGTDYHERWMTTDGSLFFIEPNAVASSVCIIEDGTGIPRHPLSR